MKFYARIWHWKVSNPEVIIDQEFLSKVITEALLFLAWKNGQKIFLVE